MFSSLHKTIAVLDYGTNALYMYTIGFSLAFEGTPTLYKTHLKPVSLY